MQIEKIIEPYIHFDVKNFFSSEDFDIIKSYMNELKSPDAKFTNNIRTISSIGEDSEEFICTDVVKKAGAKMGLKETKNNPVLVKTGEKEEKLYKILKKYYAEFLDKIEIKHKHIYNFEFARQSKWYSFPIHEDTKHKIFSLIAYISETGEGTIMYNPDKTFNKEAVWRMNGACGFEPFDKSWHSYECRNETNREVIVMTTWSSPNQRRFLK